MKRAPPSATYAERNGGPLSTAERVLLATAFATYNGQGGGASISDLVNRVDNDNLHRIGGILVALAGEDPLGDPARDGVGAGRQ